MKHPAHQNALTLWWTETGWFGRLAPIAAIIVPAILPLVLGSEYDAVINVMVQIGIYMILGLGLNVVVGYTGLLELGYVTFMATGALVTALLLMTVKPEASDKWVLPGGLTTIPDGAHLLDFPGSFLAVILISGIVCAAIGVIRGIPTLRLTGDYYAIVTLGLAEIFYLIYFNEDWMTGGAFGLKLTMKSRPELFGNTLYWDDKVFYYLVMVLVLLTIYSVWRLQNGRMGRAWAAIRLDETAAKACGINVPWAKTAAFALSGFLGGIGGGLYCVWLGTVAVRDLDVWQSIIILCAVVLGGMGSTRGVLLGTAILVSLGEILRIEVGGVRVPPEARYLIYGLMLLLLMRFRPQGLIPRSVGSRPPTPEEEEVMRDLPSPLYSLHKNGRNRPS